MPYDYRISMKTLSLSAQKCDFGVPEIDILGFEIIKNELWVSFGVPEGSQTRISKSVSSNFVDFEGGHFGRPK